jgi:hypothetical protein
VKYHALRYVMVAVLLSGVYCTALAQVSLDFSGDLEAEFGVTFSDGSLPVSAARGLLELTGKVGQGFFSDATFTLSARTTYDASLGEAEMRLWEAYTTIYLGDFDISLGQQIVFWGSADVQNPVDVINPRDLTFPLDTEKIPVPLARVVYQGLGGFRFEGVVVPIFTSAKLPDQHWQSSQEPPPGVTIIGTAPVDDQHPEASLDNVQFGVRVTSEVGIFDGADVSLSYFHGLRTTPTVGLNYLPQEDAGAYVVQPVYRYDEYDLLGVDFSLAVSGVGLRGEVAYTATGDPQGTNPEIQNHSLEAILGTEYTFPTDVLGSLSIIQSYLAADQGSSATLRTKFAVQLSYELNNRTLIETRLQQSLSDGSGVLNPNLSYTFADGVSGNLSAYLIYGNENTEFGLYRNNTQIRASLSFAF